MEDKYLQLSTFITNNSPKLSVYVTYTMISQILKSCYQTDDQYEYDTEKKCIKITKQNSANDKSTGTYR